MLKSFLLIFNPRYWRRLGFLRGTRTLFSAVPRRAAVAWRGIKAFASRNRTWLAGVAGGVAAGLIVRGLVKLFAKAEEQEAAVMRQYGRALTRDAVIAMTRRECCERIEASASRIRYMGEDNADALHSAISELVSNYHCLLQKFVSDDTVDFAITADRTLGGAAKAGVMLEDAPSHPFVVSRLRVLKDDENPFVLDNDLEMVVYLDSTNLPLKMS